MLLSASLLFLGYFGLHTAYDQGWDHSAAILCLFSFLTGVGSSLGNSAVLNACAKSFPHNRGTATAFPIAAYGLSAFVFSRISYMFFPGKTGAFLLVLSLSCGLSMFLSSFFIGVYGNQTTSYRDEYRQVGSTQRPLDSETGTLLPDDCSDRTTEDELQAEVIAEVTGTDLLKNRDFILMIVTIALCKNKKSEEKKKKTDFYLVSGSGLMYINNLGNNLTALFRAEHLLESLPQVQLEELQALNVSLVSIFNCTGRIFAGLTSDQLKHRFGLQRSAFLLLSGILFILGSIAIYLNTSSAQLAYYTSFLGFAYGNMFGIAPVLCSELFGLRNFSTNWGMMSIAPGIAGNIFNLLYGKIYDQHSDTATHECAKGLACYQDAFMYAIISAILASTTAILLYHRHRLESKRLPTPIQT